MNPVEAFLQSHNIIYTYHEHPAVYTCEQAEEYHHLMPGIAVKNLFLVDKKTWRKFLVILPAEKRANLKEFTKLFRASKLSFASADMLMQTMWLEPGSVSPFGLINNENKDVEVYIDKQVYDADIVNFHPNINTASLWLTHEMFQKYLEIIENKINIMGIL